jgi:phosphoribosylanthranilate isomerase
VTPLAGVKICGLTRVEDVRAAERAGATHAGVVFAPGRRTVTAATAARVLDRTSLIRVGVFVDEEPDALLQIAGESRLDVLQLHGDESVRYIERIRQAWDGAVWKAIRPRGAGDLLTAVEQYSSAVDGLLLDGWSPDERGGTGARFPWDEIARVRDSVPAGVSFVAAGGLTPQNVAAALRTLRPDLVDVSSGVESAPGRKDASAIERFVVASGLRTPDSEFTPQR